MDSYTKTQLINTALEKVDMKNINSENKETRNSRFERDNKDIKKLKGIITSTINLFKKDKDKSKLLTLYRMGGGKKGALPVFFPVTSINVRISQYFWLWVLSLLPHWCNISRPYLVPVSNCWNWTKTTSQRSGFSG